MGARYRNPAAASSAELIEKRLRRRRWFRSALFITGAIAAISVLLAHRGSGGDSDDWSRFDRRQITVASVNLDGSLAIELEPGSWSVPVRLIGIDLPKRGTPEAVAASRELAARALGQQFILRLEPLQTRTPDDALLVYLFATDTQNLNLELVRDGWVYADRRTPHTLKVQFEQAESDARKKKRGQLWRAPSDRTMPDWRRDWFKDQRRAR